ncbi:uncharacterized protein LOC143363132 [Halictus rubicundus]|uniref:uncharacterized protein LOC143363132 n=1 Tax=Halictus rubicundus TaxID=77578 RepID=UPI0040366A94
MMNNDCPPTVLLGLRVHVRADVGASPAEFVFGSTLRLPGEFFLSENDSPDPNVFLEEFKRFMREVRPMPVVHNCRKRVFVFKKLQSCTHVFMRRMARKALEQPYTGPHRVVNRITDRVYIIDVNGKERSVSIELLKPAFGLAELPAAATPGTSVVPADACTPGPSGSSRPVLRTYAKRKSVRFMPSAQSSC